MKKGSRQQCFSVCVLNGEMHRFLWEPQLFLGSLLLYLVGAVLGSPVCADAKGGSCGCWCDSHMGILDMNLTGISQLQQPWFLGPSSVMRDSNATPLTITLLKGMERTHDKPLCMSPASDILH